MDLLLVAAEQVKMIVSIAAVLLIPGYAILGLLPCSWAGRASVILAIALSVAVVPVAMFYSTLAGIRVDGPMATVLFLVLFLLLVFQTAVASRRARPASIENDGGELDLFSTDRVFVACFAVVLLVSASVRMLHLGDLVVPMWIDSVQHVEIAELIVARGGVPDSYRPFADVAPFSYHFGFHALVAAVHWLSGVEIPRIMLYVGQALNFAMVLSTYLLGSRIMGGRLAGLVSAAVVGVFSTMPAYYTSWGRYTQLTGMVLLPVAIVLAVEVVEPRQGSPRWRTLVLSALTVGGLIIAHPRVTVFFVCLLAAYVLVEFVGNRGRFRVALSRTVGLAVVSVGGVALVFPWLFRMASSILVRTWEGATSAGPTLSPFPYDYFANPFDRALIALAVAGLVFAIGTRNRAGIAVAVWVGFMLLSANPELFGLPGGTMMSNGAVAISLFLPISLLVGFLVKGISDLSFVRRQPVPMAILAGAFLFGATFFGAGRLVGIQNPSCILFVNQDQKAMGWIIQNTPPDATFLVSSRHWQFDIFVGSDGGYWIPALTGRKTTMPSVQYALGDRQYLEAINSVARRVSEQSFAQEDMWSLLKGWGVSYVYIGHHGGNLSHDAFARTPGFESVYDKDGVWIYRLVERSE